MRPLNPGSSSTICVPDTFDPDGKHDQCYTAECAAGLPDPVAPSDCLSKCILAAISAAGRSCKYLGHPAAVAACKAAAKAHATYKCAEACGKEKCED